MRFQQSPYNKEVLEVYEDLDCCDHREVLVGTIMPPYNECNQHCFMTNPRCTLLARDMINIAAKLDKLNGGVM